MATTMPSKSAQNAQSPRAPSMVSLSLNEPDKSSTDREETPDETPNNTPQPNLLGLPREVRDRIYHFALYEEKPIKVQKYGKERPTPPPVYRCPLPSEWGSPSQLPFVNHQIRTECLPIFYSINTFQCVTYPAAGDLLRYLHREDYLKGVTSLRLLDINGMERYNHDFRSDYRANHKMWLRNAHKVLDEFSDQGLKDTAFKMAIRFEANDSTNEKLHVVSRYVSLAELRDLEFAGHHILDRVVRLRSKKVEVKEAEAKDSV
ncbi:uncharacterized protein LTR77_009345 [Saxophila tyrrhenica]|uniref:Uncharacterized protein n=1 Tax=Saxophila tyrrhenica TaxID=1690608 RepID=A0AAV9P273_9PEZI|nr:hypothetical protein LTR77_009345 [Saxophila tyrrhenica]